METATPAETLIQLTPDAAAQIKVLLAQETDPSHTALRLYVDRGGCSGMQYGMVFDGARPDDLLSALHGVSVLVDPFSAQYLRGVLVDYSDSLTGGGFKISNPNARQSCGCGKSFEA